MTSEERASRVARNSLFGLMTFLYPTVLAIVLTPFIVHRLGIERYGVFSLATTFISVLGLLEFGMSPAIVKFVAEAATRPDAAQETTRIVGTSLVFYSVVGAVGACATTAAGFFLLSSLFHVSRSARSAATFAFTVAGAGFLLTMLLASFSAVPLALQRYDIHAALRIALTTSTALLTVTVLWAGLGLKGLVLVIAVEPALGLLLFVQADRRLIPGLGPRPHWDRSLFLKLASFSGFAFLAHVAGTVLFQFDRLVLGAINGAAAVTFYVIPGMLAQRLHTAAAALTNVVLPASSDLFAQKDEERVRRMYVRATRFTALFLLSFAIPAICFARPILLYWLGPAFAAKSTIVLQLLAATYLMFGLITVPYYIALGAGRPQIAAAFNATAAGLNVVLIAVLIPLYGIVGAAIAYLLSMAAVPVFIARIERDILRMPHDLWRELVFQLFIPAAIQISLCLLLVHLATSLVTTAALVIVTIPLLGTAFLLLGFLTVEDRELMRRLLRRGA
jgi:O-antigen/teichoic acid export membrane protein